MNTREVTDKYRLNQWTQIISECRSSGQTVAAWCAEHNINQKRYYYWLKRVRTAACEALPACSGENNPIVPLNIPVPLSGTGPASQKPSPDIIVRYGLVSLEIHNNASLSVIENTLRALQHVR
ncbi:IS66 family insertion sequence element accessory protein TnpA [Pelotomaculum propionicicum]|uniref:IS66 family insertion sequence element accessory protein TnpA n=1 Tax=Pelotomaculum propionicicum TaxID=258475 RepID=UPI003B7EE099